MSGIKQLIINSAYQEPSSHWKYNIETQTFVREQGRRPAGYIVAGQQRNSYNDQGEFKLLPLVNKIRPRVKNWRESGYPGVTGITRRLLEYWYDTEARQYPFFFCQLDAIETILWLVEASDMERIGIEVPNDRGTFQRICTKMCTGSGKTTVMAMLIAWQICNKVAYPRDKRFAKDIFIVAPGLTVKSRLSVLELGGMDNYYIQFGIVPSSMLDQLRQGQVRITNWQALSWDSDQDIAKKKTVDKRGALSDEAYTRQVLGEMSHARNILVINDEAHHAWRKNPEVKVALSGRDKKEYIDNEAEATVWIGGLDRIHRTRNILCCYDFSATPFAPSGKKNDEGSLFGWIVSDFGLNDGIESGLVKTPRVVVRDDAIQTKIGNKFRSKLYHIYSDPTVKDDINRSADETEPLPDLINQAYTLLGKDWQATYEEWRLLGMQTPPVMITVANRTETAARIKNAFDKEHVNVPELCVPDYTVRIDSKIMKEAETGAGSKKEAAVALREKVDTVGKKGKPGENVRNVISVGMLSEGWDAKTVTHILGLRAFSSQLLCEQVIGRGLRRTSYDLQDGEDQLFVPEYVNIFGIPFRFLPTEEDSSQSPPLSSPKTQIESIPERAEYCISWPNIIRLDRIWKSKLELDVNSVPLLEIDANETRIRADLAPVLDGNTDLTKCAEIDLEKLDAEMRMQSIIFKVAGRVFDATNAKWKDSGTKYGLLGQLFRVVEQYLERPNTIHVSPPLFFRSELRRRIVYMLNMNKIVQHIVDYIKTSQSEKLIPIYDTNHRICSTADMLTWFTSKPVELTKKSQISHVVCDGSWEGTEAYQIEKNQHVLSYAKNDHLGFKVPYTFSGVIYSYIPDFLIRLNNGVTLVLEVKGQKNARSEAKRKALEEWVRAVNETGEFGRWESDISYAVKDVDGIIEKYLI